MFSTYPERGTAIGVLQNIIFITYDDEFIIVLRRLIKTFKVSPDAYVQLALQLANYRDQVYI